MDVGRIILNSFRYPFRNLAKLPLLFLLFISVAIVPIGMAIDNKYIIVLGVIAFFAFILIVSGYLLSILKGQYNQLTKVLFAEVLGRTSGFSDEISSLQIEAAKWIRPMIFSKKRMYERRKEMAASFAEFMLRSQNPALHKMREEIDYAQWLRDWPTRAKALYSSQSPLDANRIFALVKELSAKPEAYDTIRSDDILRNLVLFWIATFIARLRKQGNGIGKDLGVEFLKVLIIDGLGNLPAA